MEEFFFFFFFFYKEIEGKGTICKWRIRIEEYKVIEMIEN